MSRIIGVDMGEFGSLIGIEAHKFVRDRLSIDGCTPSAEQVTTVVAIALAVAAEFAAAVALSSGADPNRLAIAIGTATQAAQAEIVKVFGGCSDGEGTESATGN